MLKHIVLESLVSYDIFRKKGKLLTVLQAKVPYIENQIGNNIIILQRIQHQAHLQVKGAIIF